MTTLVWAGFGAALSAGVLHAAIGLGRPVSRTSLAFVLSMVFLCCYLVGGTLVWETRSPGR